MIGVFDQAGDEVQSYAGLNHESCGNRFCVLSLCFKSHRKPLESFKQGSGMMCFIFLKFALKILWKMRARSRVRKYVRWHLFGLKDDNGVRNRHLLKIILQWSC